MILDDIVAFKKLQLEEEKKAKSIDELIKDIGPSSDRNFKQAFAGGKLSIIAEIKKASPSRGIIKQNFDPVKIAEVYEMLDIDAVSVLTEKHFFKGMDDYISMVKRVNSKPILRKDFIIDKYQVYQSKVIGADAILLIVSILGEKVKEYYELADKLGLACLTEVHDEFELGIALNAGCDIIGINNRNLKDFSENLKNTERIMKEIPKEKIIISESGIKSLSDIMYLKDLGVNGVLIGEAFMRNIEDKHEIENFIFQAKAGI